MFILMNLEKTVEQVSLPGSFDIEMFGGRVIQQEVFRRLQRDVELFCICF